jgi:membrane protease YdiL (CAAX protease family)
MPGLNFAAQPAAFTMVVSLTESATLHLPVVRFDYSDAAGFALAVMEHLAVRTSCGSGVIMFLSKMAWDLWLILAFLGVVVPWRGRARLRTLLALPSVGTKEKIVLYATTIGFQWVVAIIVAWRALARGFTVPELGLSHRNSLAVLVNSVIGAAILGGLHWLNLRRIGKMDGPAPELMRNIANRVLPKNLVEFLPYVALAVTAGVCEEFLYRGFAMAALSKVGLPTWLVVLLTSLLFGLAHTYQGKSGVAGTSLMGLIFGVFRVLTESLVPVTIWHATVDIVAGIAGKRYLLRAPEVGQVMQNQEITG